MFIFKIHNIRMFYVITSGCYDIKHGDVSLHNIPMFLPFIFYFNIFAKDILINCHLCFRYMYSVDKIVVDKDISVCYTHSFSFISFRYISQYLFAAVFQENLRACSFIFSLSIPPFSKSSIPCLNSACICASLNSELK